MSQKLTVKEAAEQLRISTALVYALCAAKKIRHERHGLGRGTIRIPPEALDEYRAVQTIGVETIAVPTPKKVRRPFQHLKL